MYPVMLDVRGQRCLVVGAGGIALGKIRGLLAEGAQVTVVAPTAVDPVVALAQQGSVTLLRRAFIDSDVEGYRLVFVATGIRAVDEQVTAAATRLGIWINVADVPDLCGFHVPSVLRRGDLHVAVASAGRAPFASRRLRQLLQRHLGEAWGPWMAAASRFRQRVRDHGLAGAAADPAYDRFFSESVDDESLAARPPTEAEQEAWLRGPVAAPVPTGMVSLVGSGPGDPALVTVAGLDRLHHADAVVYDRLAIPAIPLDLPDSVELFCVGKLPGHHPVPQEEIETLLVRLAKEGKRVVRLKGGDPFVFARGGEEVLALKRAEVPCEVIPGITAGIAVPAAAGIPVTFRGQAVRLTFITAHEGGAPHARWDLLAQDAHATLIGYMGVSSLAAVSAALLAAGMPADTPAAVVAQGTLAEQRLVRASLAGVAAQADAEGIRPPAIFVIGKVASYADELAAWLAGTLHGTRIAMVAPALKLGSRLRRAGAELLVVPTPLTRAARLVLGRAPLSAWIVRAEGELELLARERSADAEFVRTRLVCTTPQLADLARGQGWPDVTTMEATEHPTDPVVVAQLRALLA